MAEDGLPGEPEGLLAARLVERAAAAGSAGLLYVTRSETRAARLHRAAAALAPELDVLHLPAWDCLPYDRASPSREVMGARVATLLRLARRTGPCLVIAGVEAAVQRLPPAAGFSELRLDPDEPFDAAAVEAWLRRAGYAFEEEVDEPGEAAARGGVLDVFPPGARLAARVQHEDGRVQEIRRFDPLTQRSVAETLAVVLRPASELVFPEGEEGAHAPGIEHHLPDYHERMPDLFALLPDAAVVLDPEVEEARTARLAEVAEAYAARRTLLAGAEGERPPPEPARLHLDDAAWQAALRGRAVETIAEPEEAPEGALPHFHGEREPEAAFLAWLEARAAAGERTALCGPLKLARPLAERAAEHLGAELSAVPGWRALLELPPGSLALLPGALATGFVAPDAAVVAPGDVLRLRRRRGLASTLPLAEAEMQPGDAVVHRDHGLGILRGVEPVRVGEGCTDTLVLEYANGKRQLVPTDEADRLWRYGAEEGGIAPDHLDSPTWPKRRAEVEAQVAETAAALITLAAARDAARAPKLVPRRREYDRVAARFPFELTADQATGIAAVLEDLASGRPMDRLVCGDVGYGKTEVAIRAAAAAALTGKQVAVLAPTTVLARQHLATFRRRFAGTGVRVEGLSRLVKPAEAKAIKAGLADGTVGIAVGTQALAAKGVRFKSLGLLVVDEEQRFGIRQKAALRALGQGVHVLTMTATPIPRTLQSALVGLQELSVIATPPARRQPIRTFRTVADDVVIRQALRREARRGGQSFVVCPRVEDIEPLAERVRRLAPELTLVVAHGGLPAEAVDDAMLGFADGRADVLLSTNIVETGLDVPRANTMLIWRADRFGLAQLHQLRGRVGRGRVRGVITLLADPAAPPSPAAERRLRALEAHDRVGAGFVLSARDLDQRGAGDLLGEAQAGHVKLIGLGLYHHLLDRALREARGEAVEEAWAPTLAVEADAHLPEAYIPEEALRLSLHLRLGALLRRGDAAALDTLEEEVADRFGPPPPPVDMLFALARLRLRCRALGIAKLEAGPAATAATFRDAPPLVVAPLDAKGDRVILRRAGQDAAARLAAADALLARLERAGRAPRRTRADAATLEAA